MFIKTISFHYVTNWPQEMHTSLSLMHFEAEILQSISKQIQIALLEAFLT